MNLSWEDFTWLLPWFNREEILIGDFCHDLNRTDQFFRYLYQENGNSYNTIVDLVQGCSSTHICVAKWRMSCFGNIPLEITVFKDCSCPEAEPDIESELARGPIYCSTMPLNLEGKWPHLCSIATIAFILSILITKYWTKLVQNVSMQKYYQFDRHIVFADTIRYAPKMMCAALECPSSCRTNHHRR